ncbi:glycoside hydrolase family 32 protein [Candidatus Poriferisodalis sp.]|uniref:glycoside hydrolase family 32 protein n=1 Tax=Candidatus Poriferisodalis sp. TaxID=3101277 RepID=UPI003B58CAFD
MTQARIPGFHLTAPAGAINDPNGLWADATGRVHVVYQHNPAGGSCLSSGTGSGPKHWGHAWSDDMVTWTHGGSVIAPTPGWHDGDGAWSGSVVVDDKRVHAFYTGVKFQGNRWLESVCSASLDDAVALDSSIGNAKRLLIPAGNAGVGNQFRDPYVIDIDGNALMIVGGDTADGGRIMAYRSSDLVRWECLGVFFDASRASSLLPPELADATWECPKLLRFGDAAVLILSIDGELRPVVYLVGSASLETGFRADSWGYVDSAFGSYATHVAQLGDYGPCSISWVRGPSLSRRRSDDRGHLTMLRRLELNADRRFTARFVRSPHEVAQAVGMQSRRFCGEVSFSGPRTALFEATLKTDHAPSDMRLAHFRIGTADERLDLQVDLALKHVNLRTPNHETSLEVHASEVDLDVVWDAPIVEIIIDGHSLTYNFMPSDDDVTLSLKLSHGAHAAGTIAVEPEQPSGSL